MLRKSILAAFAVLLVSGCVRDAPRAPSLTPQLNGTDVAWVQLMIPMNEQALPLLELAIRRAGECVRPYVAAGERGGPAESGWRTLALQIQQTHGSELIRLRQLRDQAGLSDTNVHSGHDMPGLVSAADLAAIEWADDAAFTRLLADTLHEHLYQSAQLARSEQEAGADVSARALAGDIATARESQLAQLRRCV